MEVADYSRIFAHRFDEAAKSSGLECHSLRIADAGIALRSAGSTWWSAIAPALAPVTTAGGEVDATVSIWDTASTGVRCPLLPWGADEIDPFGVVEGNDTAPQRIVAHPVSRTVAVIELDEPSAVAWTSDVDALPWWERAAPLRSALPHVLQALGLQIAHAACVSEAGRGALLAG